MHIAIISASHRKKSESKRISDIIVSKLNSLPLDLNIYEIDLAELNMPLWSDKINSENKLWEDTWKNVSINLHKASGFILVVPEYGGMATPISKNLFLLCNQGELSHKPGLIVSISSGVGGAYPIADLRSFSYKNTHIMWIPENMIIRSVEQFLPGMHGDNIPDWIDNRLDYCLKLLVTYSENMKPLKKLINRKDFGNGM
jgi:NAD(P)H-dependent FMN reductase